MEAPPTESSLQEVISSEYSLGSLLLLLDRGASPSSRSRRAGCSGRGCNALMERDIFFAAGSNARIFACTSCPMLSAEVGFSSHS